MSLIFLLLTLPRSNDYQILYHDFRPEQLSIWSFCRLEESEHGLSINDAKRKLVADGYDENILEEQLMQRGFMPGNSVRDRRYIVLEKRKYVVDEKFPRIVESSFKNNVYPKNIVKILYTIDLEGLDYFV